jgi:hypothetical protein
MRVLLSLARGAFLLSLVSLWASGEDPQNEVRKIAILQTTIAAHLDTAQKVQEQLGEKYRATGVFEVTVSPVALVGYGAEDLKKAFEQAGTDLISFAYVDKERVALFLFDANREGKYIATSVPLAGNPVNRITDEWIELSMNRALNDLLKQFSAANFEDISVEETDAKPAELTKAERSRMLFNELATTHDGTYFVGANLGIARFSAQGSSASVVNIGIYGGRKVSRRFKAELGVDLYSYLMLHGDVRYQLPIAERYVTLELGLGVNHVTLQLTQNRGFNPTSVSLGQFLVGPAISIDVPLLGASVRGEIRALFGQAFILVASYGLSYTL